MYAVICATPAALADELRALDGAAFVARVFGGGTARALVEDHEGTLHLSTLWAAVDFVLTGLPFDQPAPAPLGFLRPSGGGEPVGPGVGPGRARLWSAPEVRALAAAVDAVGPEAIEARLRSPHLGTIYPFSGPPGDDEDELRRAAVRVLGAGAEPSLTVDALLAMVRPARGARPTAAERADVGEALVELSAFLAKVVRAESGALLSIA